MSKENEEANIWDNFLNNTTKRVQNEHGTCVIIGDTKAGKTDLVLKLCADKNLSQQAEEEDEMEQQKEMKMAQKELLSYDYFYIDDDDDTTDDSRVNVWSFNDHMFEHAFDIVGRDAMKDERFVFVICVDLGNSKKCLSSLEKWLYKTAAYIKRFYSEFPERDPMKKGTVNYLKNARSTKGLGENLTDDVVDVEVPPEEPVEAAEEKKDGEAPAEDERPATPIPEKSPEEKAEEEKLKAADDKRYAFIHKYLGVSIIVVGCKSDLVSMDDADDVRAHREMQGKIRSLCLEAGAALIYSSTYIDTNIATLKKYIEHRLYPENLLLQNQQGELAMEDKVNETFIPGGFDTFDLIKYSTGLTEEVLETNKFIDSFDDSKIHDIQDTSEHVERPEPETLDIESEQQWLGGLYSFVTQVTGGAVLADVKSTTPGPEVSKVDTEVSGEEKKEVDTGSVSKKAHSTAAHTGDVGDFFKSLLSAPVRK